ncbi:unnamed protein product, partial [Musa acuminata subsp. burmannicoides]
MPRPWTGQWRGCPISNTRDRTWKERCTHVSSCRGGELFWHAWC